MTYTDEFAPRFSPGFIRTAECCIPFYRLIATMCLKPSYPALVLMALLSAVCSLSSSPTARAEPSAMEQLLQILSTKAVMTPEEVKTVKEALEKEKAEMRLKEEALEEKEKALAQREKDLAEKEKALQPKTAGAAPAAAPVSAAETTGISLRASYDEGFQLSTPDPDLFSLRIGGLLQTDYRYYDYDAKDPNKNRFDIRRARLLLGGTLYRYFDYKFEYEFQGSGSRNLLDAYTDVHVTPWASLRLGQGKEPFGLEQVTKDKNLYFAERSMGYYLTPQRDLGLMAHGSLFHDRINYGVGIFNGDGLDDASGGDQDSPEFAGRLVLAPFKTSGFDLLQDLQFGGSFTYCDIDRNNVQVQVKTTGLTTFFDVAAGAKFNVIRDAGEKKRYGVELGWAFGPLAVSSEYVELEFTDINTSAGSFNASMEDTYVALLWMLTGEHPRYRKGVFQPVRPRHNFLEGGWGALGLALRYDRFDAEPSVYDDLVVEGYSVRKAEAYSIALNWFLNPAVRLIIDATRTDFDKPLIIDHDPLSGELIYAKREDVLTGRFQLGF
jgi:phosphate-selective porin OprO/OprP